MGRAEERRRLKQQKKQFKKQGMSEKHYQDFMKKVDEKYYRDIVLTAYQDVYKEFSKKLKETMKENRISEARAEKIIVEAVKKMKDVELSLTKVVE